MSAKEENPAQHVPKATLRREITLFGLTMVVIGSCIGSGIFLTPSQVAGHLPSPFLILAVWGTGGLIAMCGALVYAELSGMFPEAGGAYVFLREAYGDLAAFLYGWSALFVIASGAVAALCIACANYLSFLFPMTAPMVKIVAVLLAVIITIINVLRVKAGAWFNSVFTGLKLLGILGIIIAGFFWGEPRLASQSGITPSSTSLTAAFGLGLIGVLWSYGGWQTASFVAGETKNPQRVVPRGTILGTLIVVIVYLLVNLAYLFLLPVDKIAGSDSLAADALSTVIPAGGLIIAMIIAMATFGTASAYTLAVPRIYYAMARDRLFFRSIARVHSKFRTPANAILIQSAWAIALMIFWGTFENVITYVVFTDWIFFGSIAFSVILFRHRRKDLKRPYRTWGYPVTPLIFVFAAVFFVVNTLIQRPLQAWAGLLLMGVGTVLFFLFKKKSGSVS